MASETAQTLDRGLRLLQLIAAAPHGLTVTEAAGRLGVGRAVIYRLAATLVSHRLVQREPTGRLRLGTGVLQLVGQLRPVLADAARGPLHTLAEQVGATAHLTLADDGEAVAVMVVEPSWTTFHVGYRRGSRHPLTRGAAGRAILAGQRGESGWVSSVGELQAGAHGVAAPIVLPDGAGVMASVGVVALTELDPAEVGPQVVAAARAVAAALT